MKLVKLKLKNFRCYKDEITISFDSLTVLIGKNDAGKSTILEALDAFFNDKIEAVDLSATSANSTVEITCFFENLPNEMVLDSSELTNLYEEGILNSFHQLEIKKTYTFQSKKSAAVYLVCQYFQDPILQGLLSLKKEQLKSKADALKISLDGVNKNKNPQLRKAIRNFCPDKKRTSTELKVDGNLDGEDNLKGIWNSIKKQLPVYTLFKVDRPLDDKDDDIQDPMKAAVSETLAVPEIQQMLKDVEEKIQKAVTEVADKTIEKLKDIDARLAETLKSKFSKDPAYNKVFDLTLLNEKDIPLNKRGSGIRRLVLLSFFQYQAERKKADLNSPSIIYALEEPETSQHPDHQRMLIDALINLSDREQIQVMFTTHSANLVKEIPYHVLRYIHQSAGKIVIENGYKNDGGGANELIIDEIIRTLGLLPNPRDSVKVLLFVEGVHDVEALQRYSKIFHDHDSNYLNLISEESVGYVLTGGSSLKHYVERKYLSGLGKPEVHIYDGDREEYKTVVEKINSAGSKSKRAYTTQKLMLESYLHLEAIQESYSESGTTITLPNFGDLDHVPKLVAEAIYSAAGQDWSKLDDIKKKELTDRKKKHLNSAAVEKMTIDRIKARSSYDEMSEWFKAIKEIASK